jgi:hypothetical protein
VSPNPLSGVDIDNLKIDNYQTQRLRGELSVYLKDYVGLKYGKAIAFGIFDDLQYRSLAKLYKRAKERLKMETR